MKKRIDNKHHIDVNVQGDPVIVKTTNGQVIPAGEPIILFRGRDKLALPMLNHYRSLCVADGCTQYQLESLDGMIEEFREFSQTSETMKQPGCTLGK